MHARRENVLKRAWKWKGNTFGYIPSDFIAGDNVHISSQAIAPVLVQNFIHTQEFIVLLP